jgi:hypothetical protein
MKLGAARWSSEVVNDDQTELRGVAVVGDETNVRAETQEVI